MRDALEQLLPMYRLHAQVAMGALLKVPRVRGRRTTPADRNAFSQKIVDFVVEDPTTGKDFNQEAAATTKQYSTHDTALAKKLWCAIATRSPNGTMQSPRRPQVTIRNGCPATHR